MIRAGYSTYSHDEYLIGRTTLQQAGFTVNAVSPRPDVGSYPTLFTLSQQYKYYWEV